jgi:hypothetical protein
MFELHRDGIDREVMSAFGGDVIALAAHFDTYSTPGYTAPAPEVASAPVSPMAAFRL